MDITNHILAIDVQEMIQVWAPIILFVVYGAAQLVGNFQQEKRKAAQRPQPKPAPPQDFGAPAAPPAAAAPRAGAGGQQPTLEETLRREVDEFLRRAQGQPQQPKAQQQRPQQQQRPPQPARPRQPQQPAAPLQQRQPPPRQRIEPPSPVQSPTRPVPGAPLAGGSIAQRVAEDLRGAQALVQHAQQLGAEISQTDQRVAAHLRETFSHQLGSLATTAATIQPQPAALQKSTTSTAQELRNMLARPGGARQMIILGEVLRRPEERW